jgi:hypothetical protein
VIPTRGKLGGTAPMAFTEQGVAMLSSAPRHARRASEHCHHARLRSVARHADVETRTSLGRCSPSKTNTTPNSGSCSTPSANDGRPTPAAKTGDRIQALVPSPGFPLPNS